MRSRFFNATLTLILLVSFTVSGFTYSKETQKELSKVHPRLVNNFFEVSNEMKKFYPEVRFEIGWRGGQRTCDEQMELFSQGRSKPGPIVTNARCPQTYHTVIGATDFVVFRNGKLDWSIWKNRLFLNRFSNIVRGNGLVWGGDFKRFPDLGHVQLPYKLSFLQKLCGYNGCNKSEASKIIALGGSKTNFANQAVTTPLVASKKTPKNDNLKVKPTPVSSPNTNSVTSLQTGLPIIFRELPGQVCRLKGGILYCKTA
jgi:D-alanyl-D-alanine carboxypeptidase